MKSQKGITLIALVVTIIVLLILAGVAIQIALDDGIVDYANTATEDYREAEVLEEMQVLMARRYLDEQTKGTEAGTLNEFLSPKVDSIEEQDSNTIVVEKNGVRVTITKKDDGMYEIKGNKETDARGYLVDIVEVGDYVDIGIDYKNKQDFDATEHISTTNALTGWRVLSKSGSGKTGTVKLVSAGCPLTYYHKNGESSISITNLEDLNKELTIVTSGIGFGENGFGINDLTTVFTQEKYIDTSKGVHALGCSTHYSTNSGTLATAYEPINEIEEAYTVITKDQKTMTELYGDKKLGTTTLREVAGNNWKDSYIDLFSIGQPYYLGGASYNKSWLFAVNNVGSVTLHYDWEIGIRPVVSLQSGVKVSSTNEGDGSSSDSAYSITK